jgi:tetratricopeptide (TPR) repeat protein
MARFILPSSLIFFAISLSFAQETPVPPSAADKAWQMGKIALEADRVEEAIGQFQLSLRLDPKGVEPHLNLAAAYLLQGQEEQAIPHLLRYLAGRPGHAIVRAQLAELLLRLDRPEEARDHFERFCADVQDQPGAAQEHLVQSHSRLMEIAEDEGDEYAEHLHRGIGLFLFALKKAGSGKEKAACDEGILFKAAAELTLARRCAPQEARPCWYLFRVWSQLGQRQPASRCLRAAEEAAPLSDLTQAERRGLHLALRREQKGERN